MIYWLLPRLWRTPLWSEKLANWHFWTGTVGILMYVLAMYNSGITQGLMWRAFDSAGRLVYPDFMETVVQIKPMYWVRLIGGTLYLSGVVMLIVNVWMTIRRAPKDLSDPSVALPIQPARRRRRRPLIPPRTGARPCARYPPTPMKFLDTNGFHRRLEGWPLVFTSLTTLAVLVGGFVEFLPLVLVDDQTEEIATVEPFTPLEVAGRDLYIREGCVGCHSQMVRPFRHEIERYGDYSKPGETVYESPFLWGSKRTGPDLARVGGKYPDLWHVRHMENPRSTSPRSIMPPYPHLLTHRLDFEDIPGKLTALRTVGVPYSDAEIENAVSLAEAQAAKVAAAVAEQGGPSGLEDKEIAALVAYLQRLGTFLEAAPAEDNLEPHEREEVIETMQDEQPGDLPGTDLEVEDLPPGTQPSDVDLDRSADGTVVDDEPVDQAPDQP